MLWIYGYYKCLFIYLFPARKKRFFSITPSLYNAILFDLDLGLFRSFDARVVTKQEDEEEEDEEAYHTKYTHTYKYFILRYMYFVLVGFFFSETVADNPFRK